MKEVGAAFHGLDRALRWLRLEAGRRQREVAQAAGITQAMLCSYEQGKRTPSLQSLERILHALGVDLAQLSHALALVNGRAKPPARGSSSGAGDPGPGRAPSSSDEHDDDPPFDLGRFLGSGRLPAREEAALRQMVGGFLRWLRLLHAAGGIPTGGGR